MQTATQQSGIDDSSDAYENGTQSTESMLARSNNFMNLSPTLADSSGIGPTIQVGALATKFVVGGVTGVTDATDIFNNSYETEGSGCGE